MFVRKTSMRRVLLKASALAIVFTMIFSTLPIHVVEANMLEEASTGAYRAVEESIEIKTTEEQALESQETEEESTETKKNEEESLEAYVAAEAAISAYYNEVDVMAASVGLTFNVMGDGWQSRNLPVPAVNGSHSVTANFSSGTRGIINMGYFSIISGNVTTVTVNSIIVNGIPFDMGNVLHVGEGSQNALPNIWNFQWAGVDGPRIATSGGNWLAYNFAANLIRLYGPGGATIPITTVQYNFTVHTGTFDPGPDPGSSPGSGPGSVAIVPLPPNLSGRVMATNRSLEYAQRMGHGWNLGNTLDGLGYNSQAGNNVTGWETAWGNPVTTRALINSIADRGFDHIRIPFSIANSPPHASSRYTDRGSNTPSDELRFVIDPAWLARYYEVVQWALDAGLYVMINIHHDSWTWIGRQNSQWGGDTDSWQYRRFRDHWTQLAQLFANTPDRVSFETINEPHFENPPSGVSEQQMLNWLNHTAFNIIRATPGNENRMIVIPTIWTRTDAVDCRDTRNFINSLNDEDIIATVHYYGQWVFGSNLGRTMFDENLWDGVDTGTNTTRFYVREMYRIIQNYFMSTGIGINIGEWGLLAYDKGDDILQTGEELKYYEYMKYLASQFGSVNLTFWDNGSGIDRRSADFTWAQPRKGAVIEASLRGERSSYSTGLDTLYFNTPVTANVTIPLTLNGNTFVGIRGLTRGVHYTFNNNAVTLMMNYVNEQFNAMGNEYGVFAELVMQFSAGADWHQFLVRNGTPAYGAATGRRGGDYATGGIFIPVNFNGNHIRRVSAFSGTGIASHAPIPPDRRIGGSHFSWWNWLDNGHAFRINYDAGYLHLRPDFFSNSVRRGYSTVRVEMFDGQIMDILLDVQGDSGANTVVRAIAGRS